MKKSILVLLCVSIVALGLATQVGAEGWLVLGPTDFQSWEGSGILSKESAALIVHNNQVGPASIFLNIPISVPGPLGSVIDNVVVCYKTSNARTFISGTTLAQRLLASSVTQVSSDPTPHASVADECYASPVPNVTPGGAMFLRLLLTFGNIDDFIVVGAVAVHFH